jgi:hypothetical protein
MALMVGLAAGLIRRPDTTHSTQSTAGATDRSEDSGSGARRRTAGPGPVLSGLAVMAALLVMTAQVVTGWGFRIVHPVAASTHVLGAPDDLILGRILSRYDLVISNSPSRLYSSTGRSSITPPTRIRPSTLEPNPLHDAQLIDMGNIMRRYNSAFVYYAAEEYYGSTFLDGPSVAARLDLERVGMSKTKDAVVYAPRKRTFARQ